jgi:alkylhydroperoxidase family enzyme
MASPPAMPSANALVRFVRTLAETSGTVSDDDFAAIKAAGYTDAQLVDISLAFGDLLDQLVEARGYEFHQRQDFPDLR